MNSKLLVRLYLCDLSAHSGRKQHPLSVFEVSTRQRLQGESAAVFLCVNLPRYAAIDSLTEKRQFLPTDLQLNRWDELEPFFMIWNSRT